MPPKDEYIELIDQIWESGWLTNNGPLVTRLEKKLKEAFGVKHLFFVTNGTSALQIAIKALELTGEIITTPYSYVATSSSIVWEGAKPKFVDIDKGTWNIDPSLIKEKVDQSTSGIIATHVYGNPCDIDGITRVAKDQNLKVIYDASHCFDTYLRGKHILNYGDVATISFHATKLFHTIEGGAIVTNDDEMAHRISYMRDFGHNGEEAFWGLGINAKNSEFHAAMGLCNMMHFDKIKIGLTERFEFYSNLFCDLPIQLQQLSNDSNITHGFFPVVFESTEVMLQIKSALNQESIFPRRYFYPSLNNLPYVESINEQNAQYISERVLSLPFYHNLPLDIIEKISRIINKNI